MPTLLAIAAYLLLQFGIAIWIARRIRTETDYILAGRRLGYTLLTFSIFATWFGAETVVGSAGRAYGDGVNLGSAEPFGYGLCLLLMGLLFAGPLWRRKLTTLADLYRERFSEATERVAAVILIPSSIFWAAAQMRAFGHVLSASSDTLNIDAGILIAAGVTILYTAVGGLMVDAITDVIQGVMVLLGLAVVFAAVVPLVGGFAEVQAAWTDPARVQAVPAALSTLEVLEEWMIPVAGSLLATELVGRVIAARSPNVARRSSYVAGSLYLVAGLLPLTIGLVGPSLMPSLADPEQLLPAVALQVLPTALYAIFAGALISAILSTVDSTLLVSSALLSHNLIVPLFRIVEESRKVLVARAGVLVFGIVALILARTASGVLDLVEQASALGSAGVLVTVSFGLFTPWGGPRTAIATLALGGGTYMVAAAAGAPTPFLLSLSAALACYVLGSLAERRTQSA